MIGQKNSKRIDDLVRFQMTFGASEAGPNQYVAQVDQLVMEYLLFRGFNQVDTVA